MLDALGTRWRRVGRIRGGGDALEECLRRGVERTRDALEANGMRWGGCWTRWGHVRMQQHYIMSGNLATLGCPPRISSQKAYSDAPPRP